MAKINISIDDELLTMADEFAKRNFLSRSALISQATFQYIQSREILSKLPQWTSAIRDMASKSTLSDEDQEKLRAMESAVSMFRAGTM